MVPKLTFLINHEKWYIGITNQVIFQVFQALKAHQWCQFPSMIKTFLHYLVSNLKWEKYFSPSQEQVQQDGGKEKILPTSSRNL